MKYSFRWGLPLEDEGYVTVYNFMLRNYAAAGVTRDEFLCILHLAAYHYESEEGSAEPGQATIAAEMGYGHRNSVMRLIKSLKDKGMMTVEDRPGETYVYDVSPFSLKMWELAHPNVQGDAHGSVQGDAHPNVHKERRSKRNKREEGGSPAGTDYSRYLRGQYAEPTQP